MFILQQALSSLDATKKSSSAKLEVYVIKAADRMSARNDFQHKLEEGGVTYQQKEVAGSSFEGTEFLIDNVTYRIIYKPQNGGSGLGAKETAITESAAAVYCQSLLDYDSFDENSIRKAYSAADVSSSLEEIQKINDDWILSCKTTANLVKTNYAKSGVKFHRQSSWVEKLENHFKKLSKKENTGMNINKWSPADIYMVSPTGAEINFESATNITDLNGILLKALQSRDIVGISLKKVQNSGKITAKNISKDRKIVEYVSYSVGKKDFFKSKDCFIFFTENGQIQFRTFPSFQGEIKGKTASHGKIGYGVVANILRTKFGMKSPEISDVKSKISKKDVTFLKDFYQKYTKLAKTDLLDDNTFVKKVYEMGSDYMLSKYLGCSILDSILSHKNIRNRPAASIFISDIISYASSETDLSAPYVKIE